MDCPQQPDLFGVVHVEAQHVKPGARVKHGPVAFTVTDVLALSAGGILVRGREHRHGGPIEIGGPPTLPLEVIEGPTPKEVMPYA